MKKIAAVVCWDGADSLALAEILAGLEEEGVPGEVIRVPAENPGNGSAGGIAGAWGEFPGKVIRVPAENPGNGSTGGSAGASGEFPGKLIRVPAENPGNGIAGAWGEFLGKVIQVPAENPGNGSAGGIAGVSGEFPAGPGSSMSGTYTMTASGGDPLEMAKAASEESVFGCGVGLRGGLAALFAGKTAVPLPTGAPPRLAGKNAALYIKRERFELE